MNQELGSKGGKKDYKIYLNNLKRKKKKQAQELIEYRKRIRKKNINLNKNIEDSNKKTDKPLNLVPNEIKILKKNENLEKENTISSLDIKKKNIKLDNHQQVIKKNIQDKQVEIINKIKKSNNEIINELDNNEKNIIKKQEIKEEKDLIFNPNIGKKNITNKNNNEEKKKVENNNEIIPNTKTQKTDNSLILEGQILTILDQTLEDNKFELKKIDSELFSIQKSMEETNDIKELEVLEKEIDILIEKLNYIKKQIESIIKTFDSKVPIEIPDNYLIYLVDEYKDNRKQEIELSKKLENHKEFKTVIDKIIQIESDKEELLEKLTAKKNDYNIQEEEIEKMNEQVINIENINDEIKKMMENQEKLLKEIELKVNETVHITEKVDYISEYVKHSILDLFILMSMLKRNLSLKNNAVTAISTALILNQIMKLTTPNIKKQTSLVTDLQDYTQLINNCMSDTNKLLGMIHSNLEQVSSIRYTFLNNYKECSYLDSYKEILKRLDEVEENIKNKEKEVIKIEKDIEYQLEKNNAKVKKYENVA